MDKSIALLMAINAMLGMAAGMLLQSAITGVEIRNDDRLCFYKDVVESCALGCSLKLNGSSHVSRNLSLAKP